MRALFRLAGFRLPAGASLEVQARSPLDEVQIVCLSGLEGLSIYLSQFFKVVDIFSVLEFSESPISSEFFVLPHFWSEPFI